MMAPLGPPAKGARGPIPSAMGIVEEIPLATAGGNRTKAITAALPPLVQLNQVARMSHLPLHMSICISYEGTRNPRKAHSARSLEILDLNGLQLLSPIFIINHVTSTPILPVFVLNDNTKENCALAPTHAVTVNG